MDKYKKETINITVCCPRDWFHLAKYKIQMQGAFFDDGKSIFANNSCDMMSGSIVCVQCRQALNTMFENGYRPKDDELVTPDLSIFQSHNE